MEVTKQNKAANKSNMELHKDCLFRNQLGNCLPVNVCCNAINNNICRAMQYSYSRGYKDAYMEYKKPTPAY